MPVTGCCPRESCSNTTAVFLTIEANQSIGVDCSNCEYKAAVPLKQGLELIHDDEFPLQLE